MVEAKAATYRKFLSCIVPGRRDGLVAIVLLLSCLLSFSAWIVASDSLSAEWPLAFVEMVALGSIAYLSMLGAWIVFSDRPIWNRLVVGFVLGIVPTIAFGGNFVWTWAGDSETSTAMNVLSIIMLFSVQRWLLVCLYLICGMTLQGITQWRLATDGRPKKGTVTLRQIVMLTTCLAAGIALFRELHSTELIAGRPKDWDLVFITGLLEIAFTCVFVLAPTIVSLWVGWFRRFFPVVLAALGVALASYASYSASESENTVVVTSPVGFTSYFGALCILACLAPHWGLRLIRLQDQATENPGVYHRRTGWVYTIGLLTLLGSVIALLDVPALVHAATRSSKLVTWSRVWQFARATKRVNSISDTKPEWIESSVADGTIPYAQWEDESSDYQVGLYNGWASLDISGVERVPELLTAISNLPATDIWIRSPRLGKAELQEIAVRKKLGQLTLEVDELDADGFDQLCQSLSLQWISFERRPTANHLRSLHQLNGLDRVQILNHAITFPSEAADQLAGLPIERIAVSFDNSQDLDLGVLREAKPLRAISIVHSPIDQALVDQLNRLAETHESLQKLTLTDCTLDGTALHGLRELTIENLAFRFHSKRPPVDTDWYAVAGNDALKSFDVGVFREGDKPWQDRQILDPIAIAKLNVIAGRRLMRMSFHNDRTATPLQERLQKSLDPTACLKEASHQFGLNEDGELVHLDLNWLALDKEVVKTLRSLPSLHSIRAGSPFHRVDLQRSSAISGLWRKKDWESIELPSTIDVSDETIARLATMPNLRRLVLPLYLEIPNGDHAPFPLAKLSEPEKKFWQPAVDVSSRANYDPKKQLSPRGLRKLAGHANLASLVLPGEVVSSDSISVLFTLPRLRSLHLIGARVDQAMLETLGKLQLDELSLGLDVKLATRPNSFAAFDSLKMLQLFVADDTLHTSKPAREQLKAGLRKQVPHLDTLHLVTLPETGN